MQCNVMYVCMYMYVYIYNIYIYIYICVKSKTKRPEGTYPWIRLPSGCPYRPARVMLQAPSPAGPSRDQTGWRGLIPMGMCRNSFWLGCWIWGWLGHVFSQQSVWLWEITHDLQPNCWLKTSNHVQMSTKQWTKRCTASKLTAYDASAEGGGGPPTFQWWCWGMGEKAMRESFEKERAILARCENGDCLMHIIYYCGSGKISEYRIIQRNMPKMADFLKMNFSCTCSSSCFGPWVSLLRDGAVLLLEATGSMSIKHGLVEYSRIGCIRC